MTDSADLITTDCAATIFARTTTAYSSQPAGPIFGGVTSTSFRWIDTRDRRLAAPIRAATLDWLAGALTRAAGGDFGIVRQMIVDAIPDSCEMILDGGSDFIFALDQAAIVLGCDPDAVVLRPRLLNS